MSNLGAPPMGELALGAELKRQTSRTLFGEIVVLGASFDVFQFTLQYAGRWSDSLGAISGDATLRLSPGGFDHRNTRAALADYSQGQTRQTSYVYLTADIARTTRLPAIWGLRGWGLLDTVTAQYSPVPLPLTEKSGLGSSALVRGYTLDDGAFDTSVVSRNELHAPALPLFHGTVDPFAFVDIGYGKDRATKREAQAASIGFGVTAQYAPYLGLQMMAATALRSAGQTSAGDCRIESRLTFSF